eukprot:12098708-Alexandrium_andersonii.AAC.1
MGKESTTCPPERTLRGIKNYFLACLPRQAHTHLQTARLLKWQGCTATRLPSVHRGLLHSA